ncbi:hypothetical protein, partial [Sodalis-like endosymbiont of Proechinophthirus fluctus]|uniref:hypothetical protein n=1 Tax=Sodalis-like endosymbiont of Proechinophthirus fluctus TaxID=1462730 RepID=UPI00195EA024
ESSGALVSSCLSYDACPLSVISAQTFQTAFETPFTLTAWSIIKSVEMNKVEQQSIAVPERCVVITIRP